MSKRIEVKPSRVSSKKEPAVIAELCHNAPILPDQILLSRDQVCRLLGGIHRSTVIRFEQAGRLRPVKLNPGKPTAKTFYLKAEVLALIDD